MPRTWHPHRNGSTSGNAVKLAGNRGLLGYGPDGKLRGELAESWAPDESDPTAWIFKLRDAKFHNGDPVDAEAVKWNIETITAADSIAFLKRQFSRIAAVDVIDARTVRIKTPSASPVFLLNFANFHSMIMSPKSTEENTIGCGPFILEREERRARFEFRRNPDYFRPDAPKLERLTFVSLEDENLRVAALESGEVDLIEYIPWQSMARVEGNPNLKLDVSSGPEIGLTFNCEQGPFADPRVRNAVAFAVNRDELIEAAFGGRAFPLGGIPDIRGPFYQHPDQSVNNYWTYDPEKAKSLLSEAGVGVNLSVELLSTSQYSFLQDVAQVVQAQLVQLGMNVKLNLPDFATKLELQNKGQYQFAVQGFAPQSDDIDTLSVILQRREKPSYQQSYKYGSPEMDALLEEGRNTATQEERVPIYTKIYQMALEEAGYVGLLIRQQGYAMNNKVSGFKTLSSTLNTSSPYTLDATQIG